MSNSALISKTLKAHKSNYTEGRSGRKIEKVTIHHMGFVGAVEDCARGFQREGRNGSSHYGIGNDGIIALYVDECNTAWTNSNWDENCKSVTIETSNSERGGDWKVGDKALHSLIKLVADIGKRNNLGTLVKGKNVTWHRMFSNTICPGEYLLSKMDYIIAEANKINATQTDKEADIVETNEPTYTVKKGDTLWKIAKTYLGNGARYTEIVAINGLKNTTIRAGQVLILPQDNVCNLGKGDTDEITVGCNVKVKNGAKTYTGGGLASFVYNRIHKVKEINGDRAVITYTGIVVCAINVADLELV